MSCPETEPVTHRPGRLGWALTLAALMLLSALLAWAGFVLGVRHLPVPVPGNDLERAFSMDSILVRLARNWDASWYLSIAELGYSRRFGFDIFSNGAIMERLYHGISARAGADETNVAFFPLFPWLLRAVAWLDGGWRPGDGVVLSATFFVGSGALYLALARSYFRDRRDVLIALLLYVFYPAAVFCWAAYPVSLINLLVLAAVLLARRRQDTAALVFAGLATATGPLPVFLAPSLVAGRVFERFQRIRAEEQFVRLRDIVHWRDLLGLVLGESGVLILMLYFFILFRDPVAFVSAQDGWAHVGVIEHVRNFLGFGWILNPMYLGIFHDTLAAPDPSKVNMLFQIVVNVIIIVGLAVLLAKAPKLMDGWLRLFMAVVLLYYVWAIPAVANIPAAAARLLYICAPAFMFFPVILGRRFSVVVAVGFALIYFMQCALFVAGYWVV